MANENPNPLFAYAEARIAAWQAVLASLKSAFALDPGGQTVEGIELSLPASGARNADLGMPTDLPKGAFNGKSLPACIELYLSSVKKKTTNKEIAAALREGGVESKAKHFDTVVTGALFGLKKTGKVLRFKDGWGLAEWYPAHLRTVTPAAKRAKKGGWKKKLRAKINTKLKEMETSSEPAPKKASELAIDFLNSKPGTAFGVADVGKHIGMGVKGARFVLANLAKRGKIEKTGQDVYRVPRPQ